MVAQLKCMTEQCLIFTQECHHRNSEFSYSERLSKLTTVYSERLPKLTTVYSEGLSKLTTVYSEGLSGLATV